MRKTSRFIPGEEIDAISNWSFGVVDSPALRMAAQDKARQEAAEQLRDDALRQDGYAEGFAQGQARAVLQAQQAMNDYVDAQGRQAAGRFAQLFASAEQALAQSRQVMAQGVLELACELARQVLRHELSVNPNVLQPVIREALGLLAQGDKGATVRLHPMDIEVMQDALRDEFAALSLSLIADPSVEPGGCLVASGGTLVDGTLETRWRRAVANLGLGVPWGEPDDGR